MTETVTLTDVRTEQADQLQHDIDAAAAKLKDDVTPAEDKADQRVKKDEAILVKLRADASVLQQQLAVATMKPERHAIELQLYDNLKEQRSATAALATDQDQQADCTRQAQTLTSRLTVLKTAHAQVSADLDAARQQDSAAANDRAALSTSPANAQQEAGSDAVKAQVAAASDALAKLAGGPNLVDVLRARYEHGQAIAGEKPARGGPSPAGGAVPDAAQRPPRRRGRRRVGDLRKGAYLGQSLGHHRRGRPRGGANGAAANHRNRGLLAAGINRDQRLGQGRDRLWSGGGGPGLPRSRDGRHSRQGRP